ncbi:MAG: D-lyxose ketol-isomerase [Polaromonas sp.]|jgi:D-lyxose ketol-isomerase
MNQSRLNDIVAEADAMICSFGLALAPRAYLTPAEFQAVRAMLGQ